MPMTEYNENRLHIGIEGYHHACLKDPKRLGLGPYQLHKTFSASKYINMDVLNLKCVNAKIL
jgi:hypothetical protein